MSWRQTALTAGPRAHAHSYYDIPVWDGGGAVVVGWCPPATSNGPGRHPGPEDAAEVGFVRAAEPGSWQRLGESRAWSWQQGPLAQWVAGGPRVVWNDREAGRIVARLHDVETGATRTLPGQVYAVTPDGATALSLDLMRLDRLRPGYGYPGGSGPGKRTPDDAGVRAIDLGTGESRMVLPLARAVAFLNGGRGWRDRLRRLGMHYWFNHAKIAPGGRRFTVKLRWRKVGGPWTDAQGVSLTCGMDGTDLRLLAPATSHVIWLDDATLYYWRQGGLRLVRDDAAGGEDLGPLAEGFVTDNVHARHLDAEGQRFVFDTPYRETVELVEWDRGTGAAEPIAHFAGHVPAKGPFRCDLHPVPSPHGRRIVVTSLQGGTRQMHLLERDT